MHIPGVMKPVGMLVNWGYKTIMYRLKFEARPVNAYIFRTKPSDELLASIQVEIENHNDSPLLISSIELQYGDLLLRPTSALYATRSTIVPLNSTPFPHRIEAHSHSTPLVMFDVNDTTVPECTLILRVGRYERRYDLSLSFRERL